MKWFEKFFSVYFRQIISLSLTALFEVAAYSFFKGLYQAEPLTIFPLILAASLVIGLILFSVATVIGRSSTDHKVLEQMGFRKTVSQLEDSDYEPRGSMKLAKRSLRFVGLLGSKWIDEPEERSAFIAFLKDMEFIEGKVQFLLIDPEGQAFQRLQNHRGGEVSTDCIKHWKSLCEKHSCLEVRLYDHLPCFRLILFDDTTVVLSRYKEGRQEWRASRLGWEAPHLVFDSNSDWTLFDAFDTYWKEEWRVAKNIHTTTSKKQSKG